LHSHRGVDGGYELARPAHDITVGDVVRAVGGALTTVRGLPTTTATYRGAASGLRDVWVAVEVAIQGVVDNKTLAELSITTLTT
jgi:Rrf2 family protein